MTAGARAAIAEADTFIGYVTYIRLVAFLVDGKEVIKKSMTEELDRAIKSVDRARQGKKVAMISSGDADYAPPGTEGFMSGSRPVAIRRSRCQLRSLGAVVGSERL